jgi:hypothetical protein
MPPAIAADASLCAEQLEAALAEVADVPLCAEQPSMPAAVADTPLCAEQASMLAEVAEVPLCAEQPSMLAALAALAVLAVLAEVAVVLWPDAQQSMLAEPLFIPAVLAEVADVWVLSWSQAWPTPQAPQVRTANDSTRTRETFTVHLRKQLGRSQDDCNATMVASAPTAKSLSPGLQVSVRTVQKGPLYSM